MMAHATCLRRGCRPVSCLICSDTSCYWCGRQYLDHPQSGAGVCLDCQASRAGDVRRLVGGAA